MRCRQDHDLNFGYSLKLVTCIMEPLPSLSQARMVTTRLSRYCYLRDAMSTSWTKLADYFKVHHQVATLLRWPRDATLTRPRIVDLLPSVSLALALKDTGLLQAYSFEQGRCNLPGHASATALCSKPRPPSGSGHARQHLFRTSDMAQLTAPSTFTAYLAAPA